MKTTFIVDIDSYIILLCKMRKRARHDVIDAEPMMKWLAKNYPGLYAFYDFYADRGYDKEEIFRICFELLGAYPFILQKNALLPKHKKKGRYRKETCDVFDYGEYLQINKIETLNSMFKRRFGSSVKARVDKIQKVEILTKVIAYNIDRMMRLGKEVILMIIRITRVSY